MGKIMLELPDGVHKKLKILGVEKGIAMKELLVRAVEVMLVREEKYREKRR